MWENAAKHTDTPPAPPAAAEPGEYDTLLWAQIILCVLIAAGVFRCPRAGTAAVQHAAHRLPLCAGPARPRFLEHGWLPQCRALYTGNFLPSCAGCCGKSPPKRRKPPPAPALPTASRWPAPKRICRGLCSNILCRANLLLKPPLTEPALIPCRAKHRSSIPVRIFPLCRVHRFMLPQAGWCA